MDCHRYSLFLGDGRVHQGHLSKRRMIWGKSIHFCSTSLTHTSTFCHRSLFLGDGKVHEGHVGKARLIWGNGCISVPHLFIKVQGCKTYTSTICMVQKFEQTTWKTDKFMLAPACCKKSVHQGSTLQNPRFNLLHRIQLVHLLSLPAMSANLHLLFPMHASRQKVGFNGGG